METVRFFAPKISVFRIVVAEFVDDSHVPDMLAGLRSLPAVIETADAGGLVTPHGMHWVFQGPVSDGLLALIRTWARPLTRIEDTRGFVGKAANDCWWAYEFRAASGESLTVQDRESMSLVLREDEARRLERRLPSGCKLRMADPGPSGPVL